jgi:hypothetical protein
MASNDLIPIQQLCTHYNISVSFIDALNNIELIKIIYLGDIQCISKTQINELERMMRLHYDLNINIEGIDAINNLLKKVESLNEHIMELHNKLKRFDPH